jgi:hypothetical protein
MSMEWEYVFELRPKTDLLFTPQMVYDYGQPWWNDTDRVKPENSRKNLSQCQSVSHGLTHARTRASAVRSRRVTAWAMAYW